MRRKMHFYKYILGIMLLLLIFFAIDIMVIFNKYNYYENQISDISTRKQGYTLLFKYGKEHFTDIEIDTKRNINFNYWIEDIIGSVRIEIRDKNNNKIVNTIELKKGKNSETAILQKGSYSIEVDFNSIGIGVLVGMNVAENEKSDTDGDGLPDEYESICGSNSKEIDTDGDGLSDYEEVVKYKTNPLKADSDDDGINDSEWEERREYADTIKAIVDLRVPYNLNDMNDIFQDARLINKNGNISRIEVILYPETTLILNSQKYEPVDNEYTKPTYTKNYSKEMKSDIRNKVKDCYTDMDTILMLRKEYDFPSIDVCKDLKLNRDMPLDFQLIKTDKGIEVSKESYSTKYSMDEVKDKVLFGESMYKNKTRGSCGSTAILRGTILRSAGLQERSIFTIPLFYTLDSDKTIVKADKYIDTQYLDLSSDENEGFFVVDHVLNEVLIGNQWVQVDFNIRDNFKAFDSFYNIKLINFNDPSEVDFNERFAKLDFFNERPYKYISIIEQDKRYF